ALPFEMHKAASLVLTGPDGKQIPAQLTSPGMMSPPGGLTSTVKTRADLHFVLPSLKAGNTLTLKATISTDPPAEIEGFTWHDTKGKFMELRLGKRPVLRYMHLALDESSKDARNRTYKVFHHLFDPAGQRLVTNGGPDGLYPHHRGLFYGFNR